MREFRSSEERDSDRFTHATLTAYQTVRVWVMTKNKKKMPRFAELLPSSETKVRRGAEHARAAMEILAARMGGKVRTRQKER